MFNREILFSLLLLLAPATGFVRRADSDSFSLYAYGEGINGLAVFDNNNTAYIGNSTRMSNSTPVYFTRNSDDSSSWTAKPNETESSQDPPFEEAALYIPGPNSTIKTVGFTESSNKIPSGAKTDGFMTYGKYVMHMSDSGSLETLWYAVASGTSSVWSLRWNATDDMGVVIPITLKTNPPSNGAGPTPPPM